MPFIQHDVIGRVRDLSRQSAGVRVKRWQLQYDRWRKIQHFYNRYFVMVGVWVMT